jgi:hypothetical protein
MIQNSNFIFLLLEVGESELKNDASFDQTNDTSSTQINDTSSAL